VVKGDDPVILNAISRAIVNTYKDKEKKGDINYALEIRSCFSP
jgi:hypothetical protein